METITELLKIPKALEILQLPVPYSYFSPFYTDVASVLKQSEDRQPGICSAAALGRGLQSTKASLRILKITDDPFSWEGVDDNFLDLHEFPSLEILEAPAICLVDLEPTGSNRLGFSTRLPTKLRTLQVSEAQILRHNSSHSHLQIGSR